MYSNGWGYNVMEFEQVENKNAKLLNNSLVLWSLTPIIQKCKLYPLAECDSEKISNRVEKFLNSVHSDKSTDMFKLIGATYTLLNEYKGVLILTKYDNMSHIISIYKRLLVLSTDIQLLSGKYKKDQFLSGYYKELTMNMTKNKLNKFFHEDIEFILGINGFEYNGKKINSQMAVV